MANTTQPRYHSNYHNNYHSNASRTRPLTTASAPTNGGLICRFYTSPYNFAQLRSQQKIYFYQQQHPNSAHHQARILRPRVFPTEVMQSVPLFDFPQIHERTWTTDDDKNKKRVKFCFRSESPPSEDRSGTKTVELRPESTRLFRPRRCRKVPDYHAYKRDEKTGRLPVIHEERGVLPPVVERYSEGLNTQKKLLPKICVNGEGGWKGNG